MWEEAWKTHTTKKCENVKRISRKGEERLSAAQKYANYAREVCQFEVNQTEEMAQNQMTSSLNLLRNLANHEMAQNRDAVAMEANAYIQKQKMEIVEVGQTMG